MAERHKATVQQFAQALNAHHVNDIDKFLEHYVEKIEHSKFAYKNIDEAKEYYSKEHEAHPSAEWKILDFQQDDPYNDTLSARVLYNNHIYHTIYTFSSAGKIEKIHSAHEHHHNTH
ncbi:unnamed protein product [Rotaria sp. Silwood1]|nr:unnamed protein product [Rotaria sp. Silwood1]CAF1574372.1 unnamed protein product [Rotaria sp. Silwood1]CAF1574963.1 unnamed protein product [Rotaria sp. Silwood1]CAF3632683.1 unnamed protein product [Rotaria sp. Silwood1]CAF3686165.1 unnamed protein product [Rotaria sp. Silwood1]